MERSARSKHSSLLGGSKVRTNTRVEHLKDASLGKALASLNEHYTRMEKPARSKHSSLLGGSKAGAYPRMEHLKDASLG